MVMANTISPINSSTNNSITIIFPTIFGKKNCMVILQKAVFLNNNIPKTEHQNKGTHFKGREQSNY